MSTPCWTCRCPRSLRGDFNAKHTAWNSNIVSPDGRRLLDDADRHGYEVLGPEVPTHYPYCVAHMPDVIGIAVTRGLAAAPSLDVLDDHLISDHQAVLLTLKTTPMTTSLPSPKHRQDWRIFAEHMAEHSPSFRVESPADVDRLATDLSPTVSNALPESRLDAASTRRQPQLHTSDDRREEEAAKAIAKPAVPDHEDAAERSGCQDLKRTGNSRSRILALRHRASRR
ncbi:unnamed protein product [Leptidea sinapis]|uniref:Endonuclease/exonuclease/phosphatase domain-containing protein n=1 Tax=Leptidea sinapis TaxID=189913 RepID=A0A5E4R996_9NEOP|nr:unnamed protein product [Leptidea sinapis]